jgi:hypothetical protein
VVEPVVSVEAELARTTFGEGDTRSNPEFQRSTDLVIRPWVILPSTGWVSLFWTQLQRLDQWLVQLERQIR